MGKPLHFLFMFCQILLRFCRIFKTCVERVIFFQVIPYTITYYPYIVISYSRCYDVNPKRQVELENKIKMLRALMITTGKFKGLNHPETIKCSQELDMILNKYHHLKIHNKF
jgi:stage 0 sporulation regulatory protein